VSDPTSHSSDGEQRLARVLGHVEGQRKSGHRQVHIGSGHSAKRCNFKNSIQKVAPTSRRRAIKQFLQGIEPRIAIGIDDVPKARKPTFPTQCLVDRLLGTDALSLSEESTSEKRSTAVEGPGNRTESSHEATVRIGTSRRHNTNRQGRRRQLVIGEQHQGCIDGADVRLARSRHETCRDVGSDGSLKSPPTEEKWSYLRAVSRSQFLRKRGNDATCERNHCLWAQVASVPVLCPGHEDYPTEAVHDRKRRRWMQYEGVPRRRSGMVWGSPEKFGDFLVACRRRQIASKSSSVDGTIVAEFGDAREDRRHLCFNRPTPARTPGEILDVVGREETSSAFARGM